MKLKLAIIVIFSVLISECSKDEQKSRQELLTQKEWLLKGFKVINSQGTSTDFALTTVINECNLDNSLTFEIDGTFFVNDGSNGCSDSTYFFSSGTWVITPDETKLKIFVGNVYYEYTINELSDDNMILDILGNISGRKSLDELGTFRFTFGH